MEYFLGVDIGGTKTHAALADATGRILAFHTDVGGNPEVTGFSQLAMLNQKLVRTVCDRAAITPKQITAATFGIAGFDWPSQLHQFTETVQIDGLSNITVTNDALLGLAAGSQEGWGICLIAGTSFNCRGRTRDGGEGRVVGDGLLWGEGAGAMELTTYAIQAMIAEWSKCGERTILTDALLKFYHYDSVPRLIEDLVLGRCQIDPAFAQIVISTARTGDAVAQLVVNRAAEELAVLASGVIRQLGIEDAEFELVLAGSTFRTGDILIDPLQSYVRQVAPHARFVHLQAPPVAGAVILAMQQANLDTRKIRETLLDNLTRLQPAQFRVS